MESSHCAYLWSDRKYTYFSFGARTILFRTSPYLERYTAVKEWDSGYIVVTAKYDNCPEVEDYIDLIPVLENVGIEPKTFLAPIREVQLKY